MTNLPKVDIQISGPNVIGLNQAGVFSISLTEGGSPIEPAKVERVLYLLVSRAGRTVLSGKAQQTSSPGNWQVVISADQFRSIPGGSYRLEVIVLIRGSVIPSYRSFLFDLNAYHIHLPLIRR